MEPCTLPEQQDKNYADYIDSIRREGYLKTLKQAAMGSGTSSNRRGKDAFDADPITKNKPAPDPAQ
jgi:hypothetical protein